ncbi:CPBP family intramembrane glutamic endopeptidase [Hutsoniella sourekii]
MSLIKQDVNKFSTLSLVYQLALIIFVLGFEKLMILILGSQDNYIQTVLAHPDLLSVGYYLGLLAIIVFLIIFRGKKLSQDLLAKHGRMSGKRFIQLIFIYMFGQVILALAEPVVEWILNLFQLTTLAPMDSDQVQLTTVPIFHVIYSSFLAPIFEEIVYRGSGKNLVRDHGKLLTMVISAILFAMIHYHIPTLLATFFVGIVACYITMEYSLVWAILLHFINNFIYGGIVDNLINNLDPSLAGPVEWGILLVITVVTFIIIAMNRQKIRAYLTANQSPRSAYKEAFTAPMFIVAVMYSLVMIGLQGIFIK